MELEGSQIIAADRATVWAALNDPEVLKASLPGCQSLDKQDDTHFAAVVKQKIGPVAATFNATVELQNLNPPESYTIAGEGKGGAAGFASGLAHVSLKEVEAGTELTYKVEAKMGGKIAQLGARLIHGVAKSLADKFFATFKQQVEGPPPAVATAEPPAPAADAQAADATAAQDTQAPADGAAPDAPQAEGKGLWKRIFG